MPACIVLDLCGVVEGIAIRMDRCIAGGVAQDPILLEVCDVSDLPEKGIDDAQEGDAELFVGQITDEIEGTSTGVSDQILEIRSSKVCQILRPHQLYARSASIYQPTGFP